MSKTRKKIFPIIEKKLENIGSMIINQVKSRNNLRKFIGMTGSQKPVNIKKKVKFNVNMGTKSHKKYKYTPKKR